jgi:release factor glutamine methyltransferase
MKPNACPRLGRTTTRNDQASTSLETIASWLSIITGRLPSDTPTLDAQVLLAHVLSKPRTWVLAHPEAELTFDQQDRLADTVARLQAGEPLPYVLGRWEFFGREFLVTQDVLIPRPETELLVEQALEWLHGHPSARAAVDVGTGSGCIAISLTAQIPDLHVLATDISLPALQVARVNAEKYGVDGQIDFIEADLLNPFEVEGLPVDVQPSTFNLLTANLPYIPTVTLHGLAIYQREPTLALDGGADGLDLIRRLLAQAPRYLAWQSLLLLEIEQRQGLPVQALAQQAFPRADVDIMHDLSGYDRMIRVATRDVGNNF